MPSVLQEWRGGLRVLSSHFLTFIILSSAVVGWGWGWARAWTLGPGEAWV